MTYIPIYLLIGEFPAVAFWLWAQLYCFRFIGKVEPNWRDLGWLVGVQALWPVALLCAPIPWVLWRRAVQQETCVCGHTRSQHKEWSDWSDLASFEACAHEMRSAAFLVNGEGPEMIRCRCRKFNKPNVRKRR